MGRDKARDDRFVNCSEEHEIDYIASLYPNVSEVKEFLMEKCKDGTIHYSTNMEVYELIEDSLGYDVPI